MRSIWWLLPSTRAIQDQPLVVGGEWAGPGVIGRAEDVVGGAGGGRDVADGADFGHPLAVPLLDLDKRAVNLWLALAAALHEHLLEGEVGLTGFDLVDGCSERPVLKARRTTAWASAGQLSESVSGRTLPGRAARRMVLLADDH